VSESDRNSGSPSLRLPSRVIATAILRPVGVSMLLIGPLRDQGAGHATDPKGSGVVGENSTIGATGFLGTAVQSQGKLIYCGVCGVAAATEEEKGSPVKGAGVFGSGGGNNDGIYGESGSGRGVFGFSENGDGVRGGTSAPSQDRSGVYGSGNDSNMGVHGDSFSGAGVYGASNWGIGVQGWSASKWAARFSGIPGGGNVEVTGYLSSSGKLFKIDHPLEPTNKYLIHSCVESSERLTVYSGNAILDARGEVWVDLPHWFEALNSDFRYQLTPIGGAAPNLHIAEEIAENRFKIAGGRAKLKVFPAISPSRLIVASNS
jgi:hypothetical protein